MPPRRSTAARQASATPARQTRTAASSARSTRGTPGPSTVDVVNPQLPDIQTQQSFAYGSTKTPLLPKALIMRSKMTAEEMAQTLDEEIDQAEANLRAHVAETQNIERDARARRRTESRATSVISDISQPSRGRQSQAASLTPSAVESLNIQPSTADTLNKIAEDDIEDTVEDETKYEVEVRINNSRLSRQTGSPTPSVPEWSYLQEDLHHQTGIFSPNYQTTRWPKSTRARRTRNIGGSKTSETDETAQTAHAAQHIEHIQPALVIDNASSASLFADTQQSDSLVAAAGPTIWQKLTDFFKNIYIFITDVLISLQTRLDDMINIIYDNRWDLFTSIAYRIGQLYGMFFWTILGLVLAVVIATVGVNTPRAAQYVHSKLPSVQSVLDIFHMGRGTQGIPVINISDGNIVEQIKVSLEAYNSKLTQLEGRSSDAMAKINQLVKQQHSQGSELSMIEQTLASLQQMVDDKASESNVETQKINYFSPNTGAVVDPYLTSPTKKKNFSLVQRLALAPLGGLSRYQSRPPSEALQSWEEHGDCWCTSSDSQSFTQLVVLLGQAIIPEEVVVEHVMTSASLTPQNTPKNMELWALNDLQKEIDDPILGAGWTRIASFKYEAPTQAFGKRPVQTFPVPPVMRPTRKLALRVLDNYGGPVTCLYRIKVHGQASQPPTQLSPEVESNE